MINVLLVDDEYMILKGLQKLIQWEKYGLRLAGTAENGREAFEFVKNNPIDIVITDVSMPIMDGIEFIRNMQQNSFKPYIIMLSGYQEFEYVKQGIQLGIENFLLKPIDKDMLNETLESIVMKLETEKQRLESDRLIFENTLKRWVQDEIDISEFKRLLELTGFTLFDAQKYSVFIFKYREDLLEFFEGYRQPLYFKDHDELVLIFQGDADEYLTFRQKMRHAFKMDDLLLGIGDLLVDIERVSESYEQAAVTASIAKFYQGHPISELFQRQNQITDVNSIISVDLSKFHQALSLRDENLIFKELSSLFRDLKSKKADPNYIRYYASIIISDIYREFGISDAAIMNDNIQRVYESNTIRNIETTLYRVYHEVNQTHNDVVYSDIIKGLLMILMERYYEDLTLVLIAEELHVNPMYLGQLFKKEVGVSFSRYLNSFRIKKAQELIVNTNLNFSEISEKVGYSSPGYFYKKFKKECGLSPSEYRKKYTDS